MIRLGEFDSNDASLLLVKTLEWLDTSEIEYCVERNYQGYPESLTGDLDLVISDSNMLDAAQGIKTVAEKMGWFCYQEHIWEKSAYLGFGKSIFPNRFALTIELFAGAGWHGLPYLPASEILGKRLKQGISWGPHPAHQALITCIHHLFYNGVVPVKYRDEVSSLIRQDIGTFKNALVRAFGRKLAEYLVDHIVSEDWDALPVKVWEMKVLLIMRMLLSQPLKMALALNRGYRAKRRLPEGVILFVIGNTQQTRSYFCQVLLGLANEWHLFIPPARQIIGDGIKTIEDSEIKAAFRVVRRGGVLITNCKEDCVFSLPISHPAYQITLDDSRCLVSLKGVASINEAYAINTFNETIESIAAHVWNFVLADRAQRQAE
jgi:hypothetical protein